MLLFLNAAAPVGVFSRGTTRISGSLSGISLEGMMLKLKLQYFGHLVQRVDSLKKTLILGGIGSIVCC